MYKQKAKQNIGIKAHTTKISILSSYHSNNNENNNIWRTRIFFFNLLAMQCTILLYEKIFDCEPCMPTGFEHKHQFEPIRHYLFFYYGIHWFIHYQIKIKISSKNIVYVIFFNRILLTRETIHIAFCILTKGESGRGACIIQSRHNLVLYDKKKHNTFVSMNFKMQYLIDTA